MKTSCKNCKHFQSYGWGGEVPSRWNSGDPKKFIPEFLGLSRTGGLMTSCGKCLIGNNRRRQDGTEYLAPEDAFEEFEEGKGCEDWQLHPAHDGCTPEKMVQRLNSMMQKPEIRDSYRFDAYAAIFQKVIDIVSKTKQDVEE